MAFDTVVLLSGGLDSTTLATKALRDGVLHSVVSFRYGQPNTIAEMFAADRWSAKYGVNREVVSLELSGVCSSMAVGVGISGPRVLPGRNLVMLSHAINYAVVHECKEVWFGATADDMTSYPDCRPDFVEMINRLSTTSYGVMVRAPLIGLTKREVVKQARQLEVDIDDTWSCYEPSMRTLHPCGMCDACRMRNAALTDVEEP